MTIKWPDAWKETLAWTIGGICILALSLIATFPYSLLQNRIVAELKRATGLDIRIADWTIGLPLSLEWRNVSLSKANLDPVEIAGLQAKLGVFQALTGGLGLDLFVQLNEQAARTNFVKGTLTAASFSLAGPLTVKGQLQQVDLPKIIRRYVTRGTLTGEFSHHMDADPASPNVLKGEGTWLAEATDLEIDQIPLANGKTLMLTFSKAAAGLLIPEEAVQTIDGRDVLFVRTDQGFRAQPVLVGTRSGGVAQIVSGVKAGDRVATRNAFLVKAEAKKGGDE